MLALYRSGRQAEALEAYQARATRSGRGARHRARPRAARAPPGDPQPGSGARPARRPTTRAASAPGGSRRRPAVEPAVRDVRKTVTAVFVEAGDVVRRAAEGTRSRGAAARHRPRVREVEAAVERHGGTVETVTGDAITAVFGLPVVHEDDALRAVRAAAETRARLSRWPPSSLTERGARARLPHRDQHRRGRHRRRRRLRSRGRPASR